MNSLSESRLNLPAPTRDENALVESFVAASRAIVPSVQVTLAKRIVRPGSNRVLCLAARTSVPISDDEAASVSDLALRLSDGTNVLLSLSFFNDSTSEACLPLTPSFYDPNRYSVRDEPKLGMVFVIIALVALAGLYFLLTGPFSSLLHGQSIAPTVATRHDRKPAVRKIAARPGISVFKPAVPSSSGSSLRPPESSASTLRKANRNMPRRKLSKSPNFRQDAMLVPPPPPYGPSLLNFDQLRALAPEAAVTRPTARPRSDANQSTPQSQLSPSAWKLSPNRSAVEANQLLPQARVQAPAESTPEHTASAGPAARPYESASSASDGQQTAPLPGNDSTPVQLERGPQLAEPLRSPLSVSANESNSPQLERIALPAQDSR